MGDSTVHHSADSYPEVPASNTFLVRCTLVGAACAFLLSCSEVDKPKVETAPAFQAQAYQTQAPSSLPAPEFDGVQEAVRRVFKDSAVIDRTRNPHFVAGDFNGDLSQDIAVVLKPAPDRLPNINEEFPNWILRDLSASDESRVPRMRIAANEMLLAVIHGYGPNGWRDPQATQTYLLKNAVGSGLKTLQPTSVARGSEGRPSPQLHGDVIGQMLSDKSGYLYYAGATYAWYDPKTYKGEPEPTAFHMRPNKKIKS